MTAAKRIRLVYVAAPLSPTPNRTLEANVQDAIRAASRVMQAGFVPLIPHTMYPPIDEYEQAHGTARSYREWLGYCFELLSRCDAVFVVDRSPGVDDEIRYAESIGVPVYFWFRALQEGMPPQ
jgi:hypothetical protein